ncbi:cyclin-dependent protein kinase-activating kinase CAK1 SCDLUD_000667 [Saccharomycodes ludwigii]|uniref:cyclin-dependent protein kinase-activating kinase CAK1 n=1 Tax=Saccharomycodes ludwigii TaxID=36035 RepID=UPI001E8240B0|nr:hypothetical protein SCDLUD_000667 [Saccharomycodes ludwigii]KAH3903056.1 hypothetical protein SCDLUD_000667 [Saccharomycodes ludwigii]
MMYKLAETSSWVLLTTTRYSQLYKTPNNRCVKVTAVVGLNKPYNSKKELEILKKLSSSNENMNNCIHLFTEQSGIEKGNVILVMPYISKSLLNYLYEFWKDKQGKRKFNPYLLLNNDNTNTNTTTDNKNNENLQEFKNTISTDLALDIIKQLANGLNFIHSNGIIHRDVNLSNVLVEQISIGDKVTIKYIDFGISYDVNEENKDEPADNKVTDVSTSKYKAPELLFSVKNYDYKIDVWSLMVIISQISRVVATNENLSSCIIPSFIDDGTEISPITGKFLSQGSDISLIMSIFSELGMPKLQDWPSVKKYGSLAFEGMFGSEGDGKYIFEGNGDDYSLLDRLKKFFPLFEHHEKLLLISFLPMLHLEPTKRSSSAELLETLNLHT